MYTIPSEYNERDTPNRKLLFVKWSFSFLYVITFKYTTEAEKKGNTRDENLLVGT